MKSKLQLQDMDENELIHEVLKLQKIINDRALDEKSTSQIHNYHFASNALLKLNKDKCMGSAVIIGGIYSLSGKELMCPISISDGLSNDTINGLLDDIQATYDYKTEFKPTEKRL